MIDCGRELPTVDTSWAGSNDTPAGRRAQKRAGGEIITHLQLAESVWNRAAQRADTRIVYNFGRAEDPVVRERLRTLAGSILRQVAPEEIVATRPDWTLRDAWPYGDLYVL